MTQNEFKTLLKYCRVIGIETVADLARFNREERNKGETLPQALARYAEEITPNAEQLAALKPFNIAEHRKTIKKIENELTETAEKLKKLIETYREEARGKVYKFADNLSPYTLDLSRLCVRDLDN